MALKYGNAVAIDGAEINLDTKIDGGELGVFYNKSGGNRYPPLLDKPKINGMVIIDDHNGEHYHLQDKMFEITEQDIDNIIFG